MSAGHHKGPRAGSRAHGWLVKLHEIGGEATTHGWTTATGWAGSNESFVAEAAKLVAQGVIFRRGDLYVISEDGLDWLGVPLDAPRREAPAIVAPRYVAPKRELSQRHIVRMPLTREGAHDYKNIPSLMGEQRVAHGVKAVVVNA